MAHQERASVKPGNAQATRSKKYKSCAVSEGPNTTQRLCSLHRILHRILSLPAHPRSLLGNKIHGQGEKSTLKVRQNKAKMHPKQKSCCCVLNIWKLLGAGGGTWAEETLQCQASGETGAKQRPGPRCRDRDASGIQLQTLRD